jgi:hypothetical protein
MIVLTALLFFTLTALLGSPAAVMLGQDASPDAIAALNARYGFDRPLYVQYLDWITSAARGDFGAVPFGEMEGVGLSDATRLVDDFGWTADQLINRYVGLGVCCLIALTLVYAWGVRQAWVSKNQASKD